MKKLFTATLLLALITMSAKAQLVINELMQSNVECLMDDLTEFPDSWVELYNSGTTAVNLKNYMLGTKNDATKAWQLPDKTVDPDSYVIIYCDKEGLETNRFHTDFRLESGKDGNLYLFQEGVADAIDCLVKMAKMPAPDVAYGRETDGGDTWGYELKPTPGTPNEGGVVAANHILGAPVFSKNGQVFNGQVFVNGSPFKLELLLPDGAPGDAYITYTTDGSEPKADGTIYDPDKGIDIEGTTAIRAKVFYEGWLSPVSTAQSYIFHPRSMTVPIFSVQTDDRYLNDDDIGLFANNNGKEDKKLHDWRRPVNIEMFTAEGEESIFNQLGETRIQGGQSRGNALKSMVFYANKRFDPDHKRFSYEFFPDQKPGVTDFKSFSLRDGGNDFDYLIFRDLIIQRTMGPNTDLDWQAGHTAVLYINGQYMGMLNIRERSNEDNIYSNYDGLEDLDMIEIGHEKDENDNDLFIEELKEGTIDFYNDFKAFYSEDKVHTLAEYEQWIDVSEYLNVMILNLFYCNIDFPGNNLVFWRPNNKAKVDLPKRFRVIVKDTDFGLGLYNMSETSSSSNTIDMIYNPSAHGNSWAFSEPATLLFRNMMRDDNIKDLFIDKSCVFMGDFMNGEETGAVIDDIMGEALDEFVAHRVLYPSANWYPANTRDQIINKFNDAKKWVTGQAKQNWWEQDTPPRSDYFLQHMSTQWSLGSTIPVTINKTATNIPDEVYVNGIKLTKGVFDGKLFLNREITLEGKTNVENDLIVTGWEITTTPTNGTPQTTRFDGATYTFTVPSCQSLSINAIMSEDPRGKVTIGKRGAVSFSSTKALDFTDQPVEAYIVTGKKGSSFIKKQVYTVPEETGLVVEGAEGVYKIPVAEGSSFDVNSDTPNLLQSTASEAFTVTDDGNAYYGLFYSYEKEKVGFQKKPAGFTFGVGKSYLLLTEEMAKDISELFLDETTAIQGVSNETWTDGKAYNLNGQRVDKNYRGVIVVNGKKVVNIRK